MLSIMSANIIETPALGRPFQLGMLYDASTSKLYHGYELWDKDTLQKAQKDSLYIDTQFSIITDDSLANKCSHLGASNNEKLNILVGLTNVFGAAKFLNDHKTRRETIRVSVHFKCSSQKQELDVKQLASQVTDHTTIAATRATHFVSAILFGLEAFLVIERPYSPEEQSIVASIKDKASNCAQLLANIYETGKFNFVEVDQKEASHYDFKIYSDISLPPSPSSLNEVVTTLEDSFLKFFKPNSSCTVFIPKKVWLHPITEINASSPTLVPTPTLALNGIISHVEKLNEDLCDFEVWISDIKKSNAQVCSQIQCFPEQLTKLLDLINRFRSDLMKQLSEIIPNIRNGSIASDELGGLLKDVSQSPFGSSHLTTLMKGFEQEIRATSQYLQSLSILKFVPYDDIDGLAIDFDYVVSFEFRLDASHLASLKEMDEYIRTKVLTAGPADDKVKPWYKDGSKKRAMQIKAKLFKEFAQTNSQHSDTMFVVTVATDTSLPNEGADVILYAEDEPVTFDLPSKPLDLKVKRGDNQVQLTWKKPKHGQSKISSYLVRFHSPESSESDTIETTERVTESLIINDLDPNHQYDFTVQASCKAGLGPKSDAVSIKPKPVRKSETESKPTTVVTRASTETQVQEFKEWNQIQQAISPGTMQSQSNIPGTQNQAIPSASSQAGPIVLTLPPNHLTQRMQFADLVELTLPPSTMTPWPTMTNQQSQVTPIEQIEAQQKQAIGASFVDHSPEEMEQHALNEYTTYSSAKSTAPSRYPVSPSVPATATLMMPTLESHDPHNKTLSSDKSHKTFSKMEPPRPRNVTYKSIGLEWERPSFGRNTVQYYSVLYQIQDDPDGTFKEKKTGTEEHITIDGLSCETGYVFRIQATFISGLKMESEPTGAVFTKPHLAERIRLQSKQISKKTDKKPAIYELNKIKKLLNNQKRMAKFEVGDKVEGTMKVLMVVGATGAGKTTLINGIANYMYGVQWDDDFRFVLVANEPEKKSQAHSQTSWITAYTLYKPAQESPIPYSLIIIDTPGFGDTEGIERDKKIANQIKDFFSVRPPQGIDVLHGIGFVAQASLARLSPSQQYIFDSILSIYGRDIASNIFMMTTFADGQDPPVMEAIKVANIPHQTYFKFNNSALFVNGKVDSFDAMFWEMGMKSFAAFFNGYFGKAEIRSLQLTREVLGEREQLENVLQELQPQIHAGLTKMDELQRVVILLQTNKSLIEQNKDFEIRVPVTKQRKVDVPNGRYTTNCLSCNYTCHSNCIYANDADKKDCCAMNKLSGNCTVCPEGCHWSKHVNNPYIFELYKEEEVRTSAELKGRYDTAKEGESHAETMIANIQVELNTLENEVLDHVGKARKSLIRLDKIALKPNPLSEVDYINQLIKSEQQQAKLGWQERVNAYEALRKRAALMRKIKDNKDDVDEPVFSWLSGGGSTYAPATLRYLSKPKAKRFKGEKTNQSSKKSWYKFWKQ